MLSINIGLLANGRRCHDVTAARRAVVSPFSVLQVLHFCTFLLNPHFDLEPDYLFRKPIKRRFQQYLVSTEILSASRCDLFFARNTVPHITKGKAYTRVVHGHFLIDAVLHTLFISKL